MEIGFGGSRLVEKREVVIVFGPGLKSGVEKFAESEGVVVEGEVVCSAVIIVEILLIVVHVKLVGYEVYKSYMKLLGQFNYLIVKGEG